MIRLILYAESITKKIVKGFWRKLRNTLNIITQRASSIWTDTFFFISAFFLFAFTFFLYLFHLHVYALVCLDGYDVINTRSQDHNVKKIYDVTSTTQSIYDVMINIRNFKLSEVCTLQSVLFMFFIFEIYYQLLFCIWHRIDTNNANRINSMKKGGVNNSWNNLYRSWLQTV